MKLTDEQLAKIAHDVVREMRFKKTFLRLFVPTKKPVGVVARNIRKVAR